MKPRKPGLRFQLLAFDRAWLAKVLPPLYNPLTRPAPRGAEDFLLQYE